MTKQGLYQWIILLQVKLKIGKKGFIVKHESEEKDHIIIFDSIKYYFSKQCECINVNPCIRRKIHKRNN